MPGRRWIVIGAVFAAAAVAAGAMGAHGLKDKITGEKLAVFETAARYQMYHAIGLVLTGLVAAVGEHRRATCIAGGCFVAGICLFCGWLYADALMTSVAPLPLSAPIGGMLFIVGWLALAAAACCLRPRSE